MIYLSFGGVIENWHEYRYKEIAKQIALKGASPCHPLMKSRVAASDSSCYCWAPILGAFFYAWHELAKDDQNGLKILIDAV